ncbi:MAG: sigma 54-interacting transcriptional regulator [Pseudomonadota bacterium]
MKPIRPNAMHLEDLDCERLEQALDLLPSGVFFIDSGCRIVGWNKAMIELTGYRAEEILGKPCAVLNSDRCFVLSDEQADGERIGCHLWQCRTIKRKRCRIQRKDGTWIHVVKNARLLYDDQGNVTGGVETVTDVTTLMGLEEEVEQLRRISTEIAARADFHGFLGRHPSMLRLYDLLSAAGPTDSAVLIQGGTGSGKGLAARALHACSPRRDKPFVRVSCTALSENLLESELFGHVRGAFTGAVTERMGRFEAADGGTLFLDEIGDVSPRVQTKLLRVLEEFAFERVGSNQPVQVDIRVVAATHRDLQAMCDVGTFRADLYFRLAVVPLRVPALRERREDIPLLVDRFLYRLHKRRDTPNPGVTAGALAALCAYDWPGNVRELMHALEYAAVVSGTGPITTTALPTAVQNGKLPTRAPEPGRDGGREVRAGHRGRRARPASREQVLEALRRHDGLRTRAAVELGVSRMTLWKWMQELGVRWPEDEED